MLSTANKESVLNFSVLLNLVCPGLGQLVSKRRLRGTVVGLMLILATAALLGCTNTISIGLASYIVMVLISEIEIAINKKDYKEDWEL